jgi:ChrR Cupin-like domain
MKTHNPTLEARDRAELDETIGLLAGALATPPHAALRTSLVERVADSARRHRALHTTRARRREREPVAPGLLRSVLYASAAADGRRRPGEPLSLSVIELAPGARCDAGLGLAGRASEWLVLRGELSVDGTALGALDHLGRAATPAEPVLASREGALVYLRDSGGEHLPATHSRAADAQWKDFAPGIQRRVLWHHDAAACYIARAVNGAQVPPHGHLIDEECLMLEGDLFTGDVLLREGDFQLAPAGFDHDVVQAGSDCLVYVRGDAKPQVIV